MGARTPGLLLKREPLYRLSYEGDFNAKIEIVTNHRAKRDLNPQPLTPKVSALPLVLSTHLIGFDLLKYIYLTHVNILRSTRGGGKNGKKGEGMLFGGKRGCSGLTGVGRVGRGNHPVEGYFHMFSGI